MKEPTFLKAMVQKAQARRVLEIGTFDGTSALAMAEMLPDDGTVITCEINPGLANLARKRFSRSPHGRKIEVLVGLALETLRNLTGPFNLIFIDADTENYVRYYHRALELLAPTGVLLLDNVRGITLGPMDHSRDPAVGRSEEHTSELQSQSNLVCRLLLEKKKKNTIDRKHRTNSTSTNYHGCRRA